mmetsp:Transcript_89321/g.158459  ORF Transcript_89321/g.158459 Transcript_89321/m.158459 type:complete len:91 (-) Transcript_89321:57-329(-)
MAPSSPWFLDLHQRVQQKKAQESRMDGEAGALPSDATTIETSFVMDKGSASQERLEGFLRKRCDSHLVLGPAPDMAAVEIRAALGLPPLR